VCGVQVSVSALFPSSYVTLMPWLGCEDCSSHVLLVSATPAGNPSPHSLLVSLTNYTHDGHFCANHEIGDSLLSSSYGVFAGGKPEVGNIIPNKLSLIAVCAVGPQILPGLFVTGPEGSHRHGPVARTGVTTL
jgi:hypothetical protein